MTPNLSALPRHCKHQPRAGLSATARSTYLALTVLELTHSDSSCSFDADMAFLIQSRRDNSHPRWSLITPTYFSLDKAYLPYQSTLPRPIAQLSNQLITPYWPSLPRHQASVYLWSHHNIHLQLSLLWVSDSCLCAWAPPSCSAKLPDVTLLSSMLATPLPRQTQRKEDKSHWLLLCYCSCLQVTLVLPLFSSAFFFLYLLTCSLVSQALWRQGTWFCPMAAQHRPHGCMTENPKPNVNTDNDSVRESEQVTRLSVQTRMGAGTPTCKRYSEKLSQVPYQFVLPIFQTFAAPMDFCTTLTESELCPGVQMACKQKDKLHPIFLSAGGVVVLLIFSMRLFFFFN